MRTDNRCLAKANRMPGYNYKGALINQRPDSYLHSLVLNLNHVTDAARLILWMGRDLFSINSCVIS